LVLQSRNILEGPEAESYEGEKVCTFYLYAQVVLSCPGGLMEMKGSLLLVGSNVVVELIEQTMKSMDHPTSGQAHARYRSERAGRHGNDLQRHFTLHSSRGGFER